MLVLVLFERVNAHDKSELIFLHFFLLHEQLLVCWGFKLFTSNYTCLQAFYSDFEIVKQQRELLLPSPKQGNKGIDVITHAPKYLPSFFTFLFLFSQAKNSTP